MDIIHYGTKKGLPRPVDGLDKPWFKIRLFCRDYPVFIYLFRRRLNNRPNMPATNSAIVLGSGTTAKLMSELLASDPRA
jgi:hypothetical protein